jgi:hypothetical protein
MLADLSAELSMNALTDTVEHWLTVSAAASRLGLTPDGVKSRIRRGTLRSQLGNNRRLLVAVPVSVSAEHSMDGVAERSTDISADGFANHGDRVTDTVNGHAGLLVQLARLEERLAAQASAHAGERQVLETVIVDLRGERDRLAAELADARKGWLERLLEAVRRR